MYSFCLYIFAYFFCKAVAVPSIGGSLLREQPRSVFLKAGGPHYRDHDNVAREATSYIEHIKNVLRPGGHIEHKPAQKPATIPVVKEMKILSYPFRTMLFGVSALLLLALVYTVTKQAWENIFPTRGRHRKYLLEPGDELCDVNSWQTLAEHGELDLYTCFALAFGRFKFGGTQSLQYVPRLLTLSIFQAGMACLFVVYMAGKDTGHFYAKEQSFIFRAVGSMLFGYSFWLQYESMFDECRVWIVGLMASSKVKSVSPWYVWPVIFGEIANVCFTSLMAIVMYFVMCQCKTPQEMVVSCIAMNFVLDTDNQLVQKLDIERASENFTEALNEWSTAEIVSQPCTTFALRIFPKVVTVLHFGVKLVGYYLALMFLFCSDQDLCHWIRGTDVAPYAAWPFCVNI